MEKQQVDFEVQFAAFFNMLFFFALNSGKKMLNCIPNN